MYNDIDSNDIDSNDIDSNDIDSNDIEIESNNNDISSVMKLKLKQLIFKVMKITQFKFACTFWKVITNNKVDSLDC